MNTQTSEMTVTELTIDNALGNTTANLPIPALKLELQPKHKVDLAKLSDDQRTRINQIVSSVSFSDTNSLLSFGSDAQRQLSQHLDQLLEGIRTSEAGRAGEVTIALATTIKDLNLPKVKDEVQGEGGLVGALSRLPVVGSWFSALRTLQLNHRKITQHLEKIENDAQGQLTLLKTMNNKLDRMVDATIENIKALELYMAAGQVVVLRARAEFEQQRQAVEKSREVVEIARLRDFAEQINAFETRVVRIHLAHSQSMVSVPEIRASQTATVIEMNNVMDSILFDLPSLKRAILKIASLAATVKASKATDARRALSRELTSIGSEDLQSAYLKAKESQGDLSADVAALAMSADKLLETIELGRRLDIANADRRAKAITDLSSLNRKFTDGLLLAGNQFINKAAAT